MLTRNIYAAAILYLASSLAAFAQFETVFGDQRVAPKQKATSPSNSQEIGARSRQLALQRYSESAGTERSDIRGFFLGMTRDQFSAQADRLELNTCFRRKQVEENGPELSWLVYECRTFSDLEKRERYNWSEEYEAGFSKGLKPNVLTSFKFRFISSLPDKEIISEISKQYGIKPFRDVNAVMPLGQFGNLPMGREAIFRLNNGDKITFQPAHGRNKYFYVMELESPRLESKMRTEREEQDRKPSPRPRF